MPDVHKPYAQLRESRDDLVEAETKAARALAGRHKGTLWRLLSRTDSYLVLCALADAETARGVLELLRDIHGADFVGADAFRWQEVKRRINGLKTSAWDRVLQDLRLYGPVPEEQEYDIQAYVDLALRNPTIGELK